MKKLIVLSLAITLAFGFSAYSQTVVPFYIIIGQSNTGWTSATGMTGEEAAAYGGVIPNTEIWNPGKGAYSANWEPLTVGVNTMCENYATPTQFGPEASFFKSLQNQQSKKRFVFKQGQGGTTLAYDWKPVPVYSGGEGPRWSQFTQWLTLAVSQANARGYKLDLKAVIWMQGEDDAKTLVDASAYLVNLGLFFGAIDNLWQGLVGSYGFPNNSYRKVIGRIFAPTAYPFRDIVRAAQYTYCANPLNNATMINTDNYPLQDWVHYNPTGQVQFGLDIFNSGSFEGAVSSNAVVTSGVSFGGTLMLQGAYNPASGSMTPSLNSLGILQAFAPAQPYNVAPFNYTGSESVGPGFFADHPDIVDWVLVELRSSTSPSTIVARRAAFVKSDGTLVDIDGSSTDISFPAASRGAYIVAIRHRNHLGIRSNETLDFNDGSATFDFSKNGNRLYQNQAYPATAHVGGNWLMRGGNADLNNNVKYNGPGNDQDRIQNYALGGSLSTILNNVYSFADINMDGNVKTNGPTNDQNSLLNSVLEGFISAIYVEQL